MDSGAGRGERMRIRGRRRLRLGSLALSVLLSMHCRITASALTGGYFIFMIFLIGSVVFLANPLRHFEVYLGQWSISGPGRAFRIIPMLDGIGIAMCINAIVRAISCCAIAAIAAVYVFHSVADAKLPFTYCRDFDLRSYDPVKKDIRFLRVHGSRFSMETGILDEEEESSTVGLKYRAWRNFSFMEDTDAPLRTPAPPAQVEVCLEKYPGSFPPLYSTPAYNFFYVEVVQLRPDHSFGTFNISLVSTIILAWLTLWLMMISEKLLYGKLIWNNMATWIIAMPVLWTVLLSASAAAQVTFNKTLRKVFRIGSKEIISVMADALEVALYIHSASTGTEIILGKGLNHYANGHIDPNLNTENVWHSGILLLVTGLHTGAAALCAHVDYLHPSSSHSFNMRESTLWIIPMYSKCTSTGNYSHFVSTIIFGGMMFSYMTVAFILLKTALHIIFEYRVKLVFVEQIVVGALMLTCMGLSLVCATSGGILLLESLDSIMNGVAMPVIVLMELIALIYVYRSRDFQSDIRVATEENVCPSRISVSWQVMPAVILATLIMKICMIVDTELPKKSMLMTLAPLLGVIMAVPLRAAHNAYTFLRPSPRMGT